MSPRWPVRGSSMASALHQRPFPIRSDISE
jgi:hypothetical protein